MEIKNLPGIGIKPFLSLRKHYRVSIVVWFAVVLLGAPFAWWKGKSYYIAESVFQVSPTYMKNVEADSELQLQSNSQYREYVNHLSKTVVRFDVLERALDNLRKRGIDVRPSGIPERRFIETLQSTIYVRPILDTYMVRIGMESGDRTNLDAIVNAVTNSFLETTKAEQIYGSTERLEMVRDAEVRLRSELEQFEAERLVISEKLGVSTFGEGSQNPFDGILVQARERLTRAQIERSESEIALNTFVRQREVPTDLGRSLLDMRLTDNGLSTLRAEVITRKEVITQQMLGLSPGHPSYQDLKNELKELTDRMQRREDDFDKSVFENFRVRLQANIDSKKAIETDIRATLTQLESQQADYARMFQQGLRLTAEIKKRDADLEVLRNRLNYLDTERNALGFVRLVTPALPAELPMGLGKSRMLLMLLLVAFGPAIGAAIAIDMLDRRIRSVNEAETIMGIPSAGWQIRITDLPTRMFAEEQSRRFAATLMRNRAQDDRRGFAFAAVKTAAGVSKIIDDTAKVLAELGCKVLVVQANTFLVTEGRQTPEPGLTDYMAGLASAASLPIPLVFEGVAFDQVTIGTVKNRGALQMGVLKTAVNEWLQTYDFVLVELPPILLSADSELLIENLGQVFLVVEAESVIKGEVNRTKRLLQKIDPEAVGLFVSQIPMFRGGGYIEELVIETITHVRYAQFMTMPDWQLQFEIALTKFSFYLRAHPGLRKVVLSPAVVRTVNFLLAKSVWVAAFITGKTPKHDLLAKSKAEAARHKPDHRLSERGAAPDLGLPVDLSADPAVAKKSLTARLMAGISRLHPFGSKKG